MDPKAFRRFFGSPAMLTLRDDEERARRAAPIDAAEMLRLANVALRESAGSAIAQDWQEAALKVCRAVVAAEKAAK